MTFENKENLLRLKMVVSETTALPDLRMQNAENKKERKKER